MTIWIYTGGRPSQGAKELSKLPGFKRCRMGKFVKPQDIVVNWGTKEEFPHMVLNHPNCVTDASNKLSAFKLLSAGKVRCVPWCEPGGVLLYEWQKEGATIVGRQTLTGHSGHGIIIMEEGQAIQPALLYTKYIFKVREYRVHVVQGKVIDTQKKVRNPEQEPKSWKIRSHDNGFIFTRNNVIESDERDKLSVAACDALGLDFGAVDIVEDKKGNFYVLEVNTAPGLEGQTIQRYGEAFRSIAEGKEHGQG